MSSLAPNDTLPVIRPTHSAFDDKQAKLLKLKRACESFEAIFIYYLLRTMRQATPKANLFGGGIGSEIFTQMFEEGLAEKMAATNQLGIARQIYEEYAQRVAKENHQSPSVAPLQRKTAPSPNQISRNVSGVKPERQEKVATPAFSEKRPDGPLAEYEEIIREAADTHSVDPRLVKAVILQESGGNPRAISSRGAKGLMQLMDATARLVGVSDPFDIRQNIFGGVKYLASLLQKFGGDLKKALAAYNAGPATVERYGGIPPYSETQRFVAGILARLEGLLNGAGSR